MTDEPGAQTLSATAFLNALSWTTDWLLRRVPEATVNEETRYYEEHLIDSFMAVELVGDAEEQFSIAFQNADFASDEFQSVGGFARLIARHSEAA